MPLDSYEQSWTVRALCTEKRQYIPIFTINNEDLFTRRGREITYNNTTRLMRFSKKNKCRISLWKYDSLIIFSVIGKAKWIFDNLKNQMLLALTKLKQMTWFREKTQSKSHNIMCNVDWSERWHHLQRLQQVIHLFNRNLYHLSVGGMNRKI